MKSNAMGRRTGQVVAIAAMSLALTGCGGGSGSGSGSGGGAAATAPRFTSANVTSVVENSADSFYRATARDPQGDPVSISVYSGADAASFVMDGSGNLKFDVPPNYDLPGDSDRDNVYEVVLRATAGGESVDLALRVTVKNDREGILVRTLATGFVNPVGISFVHNEPTTILVAEKGGRVLRVDTETGAIVEDTFIRDHRIEGEILAIAYGFRDRPYQEGVYLITHSRTKGLYVQAFDETTGRTAAVRLGDPWTTPVRASLTAQHSMFAAIGDPGGALAQSASSPYGKLIELPLGDPYAGASLPRGLLLDPTIIGDGIQKPGGFSHASSYLYLADQGSKVANEITIFQTDWRPLDFGWPFYEGAQAVRTDPPAAINGPTIVYPVGSGAKQGTGVIAGILNDYHSFPALGDTYVFADTNGTIWTIPIAKVMDGVLRNAGDLEVRTEDFAPENGSLDSPVGFTLGSGGYEFFILDSDGDIFGVRPA